MFFAMFLAAAAGKISKELMMRMPTHLMETVTNIARIITKRVSIRLVGMPRLLAKEILVLTANNWLKQHNQKIKTPTNKMVR